MSTFAIAGTQSFAVMDDPIEGFGWSLRNIPTAGSTISGCFSDPETIRRNYLVSRGGHVLRLSESEIEFGTPPVTVIRRNWVPLNRVTTSDPLYGVNWRYIRPWVKKGVYMRRSGVLKSYNQPTVRKVHIDTWHQLVCVDRRSQWVGSSS